MADDGVSVEVHGLQELETATGQLFERIGSQAPHAFEQVADQVRQQVSSSVPRISGAMAGSVSSQRTDQGAEVGYDGSAVYAGWVDFGGGWGRPYFPQGRFLFPATQNADTLLEAAGERMTNDEIGKVRWPQA